MDKMLERLLYERINALKSMLERNPANVHRVTIKPDPENDAKYIIDGIDPHEEPLLYKRAEQVQIALESWAPHRFEVVVFPDPNVPGRYTFEIIDRLEPIPMQTAEDDGSDAAAKPETTDGQTDAVTIPAKSSRPSRQRD